MCFYPIFGLDSGHSLSQAPGNIFNPYFVPELWNVQAAHDIRDHILAPHFHKRKKQIGPENLCMSHGTKQMMAEPGLKSKCHDFHSSKLPSLAYCLLSITGVVF